ncbi:MAG: nitroreductase family protein [Bacteroidales bacterium]
MDSLDLLTERRSVRKFTEVKVSRELITEIVSISRFAPSWANTQVVRYNIIEDKSVIAEIANTCVRGFSYNTSSINRAAGICVLSCVKGKSGSLEGKAIESEMGNENSHLWEVFDAGIACQQFCLASYAKGVATCIMGVIDNEKIANVIELPNNEYVAAIILYGYELGGHHDAPKRKDVESILRFK